MTLQCTTAPVEKAAPPSNVDLEDHVERPVDPRASTQYSFHLSPTAARKLYEALQKRGTPDARLRVGVRGGGCSGFSYVLEYSDKPPRSRDLLFSYPVERLPGDEQDPGEVQVVCDTKSIIYLSGASLDWQKSLIYRGFKIVNPKEKSSCGCAQSFTV